MLSTRLGIFYYISQKYHKRSFEKLKTFYIYHHYSYLYIFFSNFLISTSCSYTFPWLIYLFPLGYIFYFPSFYLFFNSPASLAKILNLSIPALWTWLLCCRAFNIWVFSFLNFYNISLVLNSFKALFPLFAHFHCLHIALHCLHIALHRIHITCIAFISLCIVFITLQHFKISKISFSISPTFYSLLYQYKLIFIQFFKNLN